VTLTRSLDGTTGTATFRFKRPQVTSLNNVWDNGLVTGLWIRDEEGEMLTTDLSLTFEKGRPHEVRAVLIAKSALEWARFLRFMRRYALANNLEFEPASPSDRN
jgi:photosystem II protein